LKIIINGIFYIVLHDEVFRHFYEITFLHGIASQPHILLGDVIS